MRAAFLLAAHARHLRRGVPAADDLSDVHHLVLPARPEDVTIGLIAWAVGGVNGALFNLADGYRPLFLMMAGYSVLAMVAVLFVPRGTGEADTGLR